MPVSEAVIFIMYNVESYYIVIKKQPWFEILNAVLNQTDHFKYVFYLIIFN